MFGPPFEPMVCVPCSGEAAWFSRVYWLASTRLPRGFEGTRKTCFHLGSKAWSHNGGFRPALCTCALSADETGRLHDSRSCESLAWPKSLSSRFFWLHHDYMPSSEQVPNLRNSIFPACPLESCVSPHAIFHPCNWLDRAMETYWNNFCRGSPRYWTAEWPLPGLPPDRRMQVLDRWLEPRNPMRSQPWFGTGLVLDLDD